MDNIVAWANVGPVVAGQAPDGVKDFQPKEERLVQHGDSASEQHGCPGVCAFI
jgi:hypothetical protein